MFLCCTDVVGRPLPLPVKKSAVESGHQISVEASSFSKNNTTAEVGKKLIQPIEAADMKSGIETTSPKDSNDIIAAPTVDDKPL